MECKGGSLKDGAEAFMLFLHCAQLLLQSNVLSVLDLDEMNVTSEVNIFIILLKVSFINVAEV